jgi:hypothetical protein
MRSARYCPVILMKPEMVWYENKAMQASIAMDSGMTMSTLIASVPTHVNHAKRLLLNVHVFPVQ